MLKSFSGRFDLVLMTVLQQQQYLPCCTDDETDLESLSNLPEGSSGKWENPAGGDLI